jgi:PAS domain-containing protein
MSNVFQVEFKNGKTNSFNRFFLGYYKEQNLIHKLELSVEKFSSIFSSANDAIIIIDSSTGIVQTAIQAMNSPAVTLLNW